MSNVIGRQQTTSGRSKRRRRNERPRRARRTTCQTSENTIAPYDPAKGIRWDAHRRMMDLLR